ncbi:MAG: UDP-N-acetylmuramoyl-L-alanyl-D-glutamate--2,6-diaminopimelate ligase [Anaerovoracaceae bacterium]
MGLCIDSRKIKEGDVFFCLKGVETDGHKYAEAAAKNGARIIVHEEDIENKIEGVEYIQVKDTLKALNEACDIYFDHVSKKLKMFGVTGTNGKSTTASIIRQIYDTVEPCGMVGTISISFGGENREPDLTTPDAVRLHQELYNMYENGAKAAAIEVSSHGLAMGRVDAIDFDFAIFTNLTYDHLDYHKTMENYFEAKKKLFIQLKPEAVAILNRDDFTYDELKKCTRARRVSYGIHAEDADYRAVDIHFGARHTSFTLRCPEGEFSFETNLAAEYNVYNLLAAVAALHQAGVPMERIQQEAGRIRQVPGRMERIEEGQPFTVIVDYAHTPDGFEKIFQYARKVTPKEGKLISVFGAAGKRDKQKRKVLGELAEKYCDCIFLTEQDTRNEKAADIAGQISEGIRKKDFTYVEDRYMAIEKAIRHAGSSDCIVILGKGDEPYQYREDGRQPWMGDNNAAREIIRQIMYEMNDGDVQSTSNNS